MPNSAGSRLALHDVEDAERFVSAIVARGGLLLSFEDREDLGQHLLIEIWELSLRFDGSQGSRFSAWARSTLQFRVVDWQRKRQGRTVWKFKDYTHTRPRPQLLSLDAEIDSLGEALEAIDGDPATVWDAASRGLLEDRDRRRVQDVACLDLEEASPGKG